MIYPTSNVQCTMYIRIVGGFNGFYGNGLIVGGFNGFYGNRLIVGGFLIVGKYKLWLFHKLWEAFIVIVGGFKCHM